YAPAREIIRNVSAGELIEYFAAVRFQAGLHAEPERRVSRERQNMRKKITSRVHDMNRGLAVLDSDVDVQAEYKISARHHLHVFDDFAIALVRIDLLFTPIGKGVSAGSTQAQAVVLGQRTHIATKLENLFFGLLDVLTYPSAHLDHGLVHLRFYGFAQ